MMGTIAVTKVLAGLQDLLIGVGSKAQDRAGTIVSTTRITLTKSLTNLAALQALDVTDEDNYYPFAVTMGRANVGDGLGVNWWFDIAEPITSDNGVDIIAGNGATVGCWKAVSTPNRLAINNQSGVAYTLAVTDENTLVTMSNSGSITLTIPTNSSVAFPIGSQLLIQQIGTGSVTIIGPGVLIRSVSGFVTFANQYTIVSLVKVAPDEWALVGELI